MQLHCFSLIITLWHVLPTESLIIPVAPPSNITCFAVRNANHIFNAIHAALRIWDSSFAHNGMSFFPVTLSPGIKLFHGRKDNQTVQGMEWLAFEESNSYVYSGPVYSPNCSKEAVKKGPCADGDCHERERSYWPVQQLSQQPFVDIEETTIESSSCPPQNYTPGYLQTYTPSRLLHLLYLDGESAAKTGLGTLDTQDIALRLISPNHLPPYTKLAEDFARASDLCHLAKTTWKGKTDGFLRQSIGFEVILCDFQGNLDLVESVRAEKSTFTDPYVDEDVMWMTTFDAMKGSERQRFGIGQDGVKVDFERFISYYGAQGEELWDNGQDKERDNGWKVPRLTGLKRQVVNNVFDDVTNMILGFGEESEDEEEARAPPDTNWQAVTDAIVNKYAKRLYDLAYGGKSYYGNPKLLHHVLNLLIRPSIDYDHRNSRTEIDRCATRFLPPNHRPSIAATAIYQVSSEICSTILSAQNATAALVLHSQQSSSPTPSQVSHQIRSQFRTLLRKLSWPIHKFCPDQKCRSDEICFTAIWGLGSIEDLKRPSCKGYREVGKSLFGSYWGF